MQYSAASTHKLTHFQHKVRGLSIRSRAAHIWEDAVHGEPDETCQNSYSSAQHINSDVQLKGAIHIALETGIVRRQAVVKSYIRKNVSREDIDLVWLQCVECIGCGAR